MNFDFIEHDNIYSLILDTIIHSRSRKIPKIKETQPHKKNKKIKLEKDVMICFDLI